MPIVDAGVRVYPCCAAMPSPTGSVSAAAGENWYFQLWHRDANPTLESNFTDSARVQLIN